MKPEPRYKPGDKIGGRYAVYDVKQGGMGEVYLCLDEKTHLPYALKTFKTAYLDNFQFDRKTFEKEVATWVALEKHPNIVRCFYLNILDNQPFMFLEWIASEKGYDADLRSWLRHGFIDRQFALEISIDICRGMIHAQKKQPELVHRDLKPENILISQRREAKITDFGLAEIVRHAKPEDNMIHVDLNGRNSIVNWKGIAGTPAYMPPEQWRGEKLDERTDIYALGCIIFEMLAGQRPFDVNFVPATPQEFQRLLSSIRLKHEEAQIPDLPSELPTLNILVSQCLAKRREDRPDNFHFLHDALINTYEHLFLKTPREPLNIDNIFSAIDYHNRGVTYMRLKMYDAALFDFDKAISMAPTDYEIYTVRGALNIQVNKLDQALLDLNKAIDLNPNFATAYGNRSNIYSKYGKHQEALADLNKAIQLDPNQADFWHNRAQFWRESSVFDKSEQDFNQAIQINSSNTAYYKSRSHLFYATDRPYQALLDITHAIDFDPNGDNYILRAGIYSTLRRYDEALIDIDYAVKLSPTIETALVIRASIYSSMGKHQEALEDLNNAIKLKPTAESYIDRSLCLLDLGRQEEAFEDLEISQQMGIKSSLYHFTRGKIFHSKGNHKVALNCYETAIQLDSENAEFLLHRGILYNDLQQWEEALLSLDDAILLKPQYGDAFLRRGEIYEENRRYDEALSDYDTVINIEPYRTKAYINRGNVFRKTNQLKNALTDFNCAIELDLDNFDALNNRGNTYADLGMYSEALGDYEKVIQNEPDDPMTYFNRATVFLALQQYDKALADNSKAIQLNPNYIQAYSNRGGIHLAMHNYQEALDDFSHALELDPADAKGYYNVASVYVNWNKVGDALPFLEKAGQLGIPTALELAAQIKEKLADGTVSQVHSQQYALDVFWKSGSLDDLEKAIVENPILLQPGFFLAVVDLIDQPISSDIKAALKRNLIWLTQIIRQRASMAIQQSKSLVEMREVVRQYPLLRDAKMLSTIERVIQDHVQPENKPAVEQRLEWLKQIIMEE